MFLGVFCYLAILLAFLLAWYVLIVGAEGPRRP